MHRLKCSEPDVQRYICDVGSRCAASFQNFRYEVQARCGSCNRTRLAGKHGLISLSVFRAIRPLDVRRRGHMSDSLKQFIDIALPVESDRSFSVFAPADDLNLNAIQANPLANTHFAP